MAVLKTVLSILLIVICVIATVFIVLQEGKSNGLGSLAGSSDTYWSKNKGRSAEGALVKGTRVLTILFLLLAIVLNLGIF